MQCGEAADEAASRAMLDLCIENDIRHIDTAHAYTDGASERLVGAFARPIRERVFVATKLGLTSGAGGDNLQAEFDLSRRRLGLDTVDLLYLHRFDPETPLEETMETFARMKEAGQFRYLGLSNAAAWQVMKARAAATAVGLTINVFQPMYSLVKRQAESEILPMCVSEGIVPVTYSPLGGGLLSGKYAGGETGRLTENPKYAVRYGMHWMHEAANKLGEISARVDVHPVSLAIAWVMYNSAAPVPLISGRSPKQLAPAIAGAKLTLNDVLYQELSKLVPPPAPATDRLEES
jgi:aryl-alcohol dehydrogenase-like predicted oxidoreductase